MWGHLYFSKILILRDQRIIRGTRVVHIGVFGASEAGEREKRDTPIPYFYGPSAVILTPQWTRINLGGERQNVTPEFPMAL